MTLHQFDVGFVPLTDCASLVVAREKGFAKAEGVDLHLHRQPSWAAVRDKVAFDRLDAAHMPAGLAMAMSMGLGGEVRVPMAAPIALGQGGNAITVSNALYADMESADPVSMAGSRAWRCQALAKVVSQRRARGLPPIKLAVVYPFSSHNYELRYWLAAANVHADQDVELVIVPPPRMVEHLQRGSIDGFCVGEPWNQLAIMDGLGRVVASKADLWPSSLEKVLGMRVATVEQKKPAVEALIRAVLAAAEWADQPENAAELANLLSGSAYIGLPADLIQPNLVCTPHLTEHSGPVPIERYQVFSNGLATLPWPSQARWLFAQMRRWGHAPTDVAPDTPDAIFDTTLYARAAEAMGMPFPKDVLKVEAGHDSPYAVPTTNGDMVNLPADAVFDDLPFDPNNMALYEQQLSVVTKPERRYGELQASN